jgi:DNA polymerase-3 subunit alpha
MAEFAHLHVHSDFSLLDGLARIPDLVKHTKAQGMDAIALTDHGVMFGAIDFYEEARAAGVKPIIGLEAYVTDGDRFERSGHAFHLTLLAENEEGYANLIRLTTQAHLEGFYRKPRVDHDLLRQYSKGLICLSGCPSSEISRAVREENMDRASELVDWYRQIYGDRFYMEIQNHGLHFQDTLNSGLLQLAARHRIPVVASNDVHYVRRDQSAVHEVLLCVQTQTTMSDPNRLKIETHELYLKSPSEMESLFGHVDGALSNTLAIAERCNLDLEFGRNQALPTPAIPAETKSQDYLRDLCEQGARVRFGEKIGDEVTGRLGYELDVIERTGYVDYMLLVNEFIQFAKDRGIGIGVRGSAGGSMVAYVLGLTSVDPVQHGLSFERFLNPERVSMPDIDIDIADDRRDELIQYVTERFGRDRVAQIISFGTMAARAALRDVGRATGVNLSLVDRLAKLVPFNASLGSTLELVPEFRSLYDEDPALQKLVDTAIELEGIARHASTHAAGVVMASTPLVDHVPLYKVPKNDAITTQYAMGPLDRLGLLKMDFLGLRTLTVVQRALRLISERTGRSFTVNAIPLDDAEAFNLLGRGETFGVFQVDGSGMRRLLRDMQPDRFDDIVALVALYRPGPMQFIDEFVQRRRGASSVTFPHPSLAGVLEDTYGIVVYQEQVVRMVVEVAGFSMGKADLVRKAMAKKQPDLLAKYRQDFVDGAVAKGTGKTDANQLFDIIQEFSGYGFNKAHSAVYAVLTCQTAYLKAHHPIEYLTAFLSAERENFEKVAEALGECRRLRIPIMPPTINDSELDFAIQTDKDSGSLGIRFGLAAIRNVGTIAAESIIAERRQRGRFASVGDLLRRLDWQQVNKRTLESLVRCGALDELGDRGRLNHNVERLVAYGTRSARELQSAQISLFGEADSESLEPQLELEETSSRESWLRWEKEMVGAYLSHHPLEDHSAQLEHLGARGISDLDIQDDGCTVRLAGVLSGVKPFTTKRGDQMASCLLDDLDGSIGVVVYPKVYRQCLGLVADGGIVVLDGAVTVSDGQVEIRAENIRSLEIAEEELVAGVIDDEVPAYPTEVSPPGPSPQNIKPIPFPRDRAAGGAHSHRTGNRLVIDFALGPDRQADLASIGKLYDLVLKHPGQDRIVLLLHQGGRTAQLQLPIDTARVTPAFERSLTNVVPELRLRLEQIGA